MKILAIETSCDETAIALLACTGALPSPRFKVLGNALFSQAHLHAEYGGVYPNLAKREHLKKLPLLLEKVLKDAGEDAEHPDIDLIAVTRGPGLEPALWTGIAFAEELGQKWHKPVAGINHMEGHLFSVLFGNEKPIQFPAVALLVSGGHTELVRMESFEKYETIGQTRDDAVGEAFDKVARMLDVPYPGGPEISRLAEVERQKKVVSKFNFPRPMIHSKDFDFSYSGLKTSVLYAIKKMPALDQAMKSEIALAFEEAAIEVLIEKTRRAVETYGAETLIAAGGVSANKYLRDQLRGLSDERNISLRLPLAELTTDNAIMIGIAAYVRTLGDRSSQRPDQQPEQLPNQSPSDQPQEGRSFSIKADGNLSI